MRRISLRCYFPLLWTEDTILKWGGPHEVATYYIDKDSFVDVLEMVLVSFSCFFS